MATSIHQVVSKLLRALYLRLQSVTPVRTGGPGGLISESHVQRTKQSELVRSLPFWLPTFLAVLLFIYGAIMWNLVISLTHHSGFGEPSYDDLGLHQYARALSDGQLLAAARNTFVLLVAFTLICLAVGLLLAVLLDREIRFAETIRLIFLIPFSLSFIVTAQVWLWLFNFSYGPLNTSLRAVGLPGVEWIGNPKVVLWSIIIAFVWQFSGYAMVVYLAGLRSIPTAHYEAAMVDGASTIRTYIRVIIPQLGPATVSAAVVLMVFALKAFDFLFAMFGGYRPRKGADILATKMVREAFQQQQWGYGASIAILMFLLSLAIITPYLFTQYKRGDL